MVDEYTTADNLNDAWRNFELELPLKTLPGGEPNPFYVDRPQNPTAALEQALLRPFREPPKFFFSGLRGCGKSTELLRVAAHPQINASFWPVIFAIGEEADVDNIDYKDVLLATGSQMFRQFRSQGGRLRDGLLKELDEWRGTIEKQVTITPRNVQEHEVSAKLNAFFAEAAFKTKLEPMTRTIMRQVIEENVSGLIALIDLIAADVTGKLGRLPLILIDDLDKPDLERACAIFRDHRRQMLQPNCAIVYTVSSPLFYDKSFEAIRDQRFFLPNIKLHAMGQPDDKDSEGYRVIRMFVHKRMDKSLIAADALDAAIAISGGVFREMCRVMRYAIGRAQAAGREQIVLDDIEWAAADIRNDYRRFLTREDRKLLKSLHAMPQFDQPDKLGPLLQIMAALEYANQSNWWDVHPALIPLLDEIVEDNHGSPGQA
jgi:hypothetical protein